jgi:predicted nuclease of predicted toxin-antitoxin system
MRILANENVPRAVVAALRDADHDVVWVRESMMGAADSAVLAQAQVEQRVVLTADLDFGELAFRYGLPATCGVILIRLDWRDPDADNLAIVTAVASRND